SGRDDQRGRRGSRRPRLGGVDARRRTIAADARARASPVLVVFPPPTVHGVLVNRRLLGYGPVRRYAVVLALSATVAAVLVVLQATFLAGALTSADLGAFLGAATVLVLRFAHASAIGVVSARAAASVKAQLRDEVLAKATGGRAGELATLLG